VTAGADVSQQTGPPAAGANRLLLDVPAAAPALRFPERAQALAEIVMDSDPRFAIGIFGGWGSGKTTLMETIKQLIVADRPGRAVPVWFNAWRYEKEEHLIVPLLATVREALLRWSETQARQQPREAVLARKTARTSAA
jgi:predicted KAP-like P-loop ATPase